MMIDKLIDKYLGEQTKADKFSIPIQNQIRIARKTLRMPGAMVGVMGGMNKEKAKEILKKYGVKE